MNTQSSVLCGLVVVGILLLLLVPDPALAQDQSEDDKIWASFTAWIRTNPDKVSIRIYEEKLIQDGLLQDEIKRQIETIRRLFKEHPEKKHRNHL